MSKKSSTSSSAASQRRLLEARAARELAELEKNKLEIEEKIIKAKLEEEIAILQSQHGSSSSRQRTEKWLNDNFTATCKEATPQKEYMEGAPPNKDYVEGAPPCMDYMKEAPLRTDDVKYERQYDCDCEQKQTDLDVTKLVTAINDAVKISCNSTPTSNDKLLGRLTSRNLPLFAGDALEWLRFKNAYDITTRVGKFSEEENVARLQTCLRGEAWEAVAARLIATSSASEVMKILEMRFGRPDLVLRRLILEIKKVPKLSGTRNEFIQLATKVDNCVAAIQSAGNDGYLYSPELILEIVNKFTEPIFYRWLDFSKDLPSHKPQLPVLAKYLMSEASEICKRGAVEPPSKMSSFSFKRPVLLTCDGSTDPLTTQPETACATTSKEADNKCAFCDETGHTIKLCSKFKSKDVNDRWEWICKQRLCFKCLSSTHRRDRCKSKMRCSVCAGGHNKLLHRYDWDKKSTDDKIDETTANVWAENIKKKVYLKVLPVEVHGPKGTVTVYALLDEGSTVTLIKSNVAEQIGVTGPESDLNLQGAVGEGTNSISQVVSLTVRSINSGDEYTLNRVRTIDNLTLASYSVTRDEILRYNHLKDIPLVAFEGRPSLLIGQDNWNLIISREIREGRKNEPVASLTKLGWVLHGFSSSVTNNSFLEFTCHVRSRSQTDDELHDLVNDYFRLDSIRIKCQEESRHTDEEERALMILDTKSKKINNKWETGLLWRSDDVKLPDNKRNAEIRLRSLENTMDKDASFATEYVKQVDNMLQKGYAEQVKGALTGTVWYLPHFAVRNKPGKFRVVHDAKAETKGISLNSELLSGPDLLNSLPGVLMRFRERAVAVTADIREMFMQVKICPEDQNAQCFLWRGMDRKIPPRIYKMTSMIFGAKSSPCTATYLLRRNATEFVSSHSRAVEAINKRHYVDDYLDSTDTEEEMRQLVTDVIRIHREGGFEIRGWASNRPSVLPQEMSQTSVKLLQQEDSIEKTLGLFWKPVADEFCFNLNFKKVDKKLLDGTQNPTKREMLKIIMSIFDPLGFLCPFIIRGKILLQTLWKSGLGWDDEVDDNFNKEWTKWLNDLKRLENFSVPRCYGFLEMNNFELHTFVDSSREAYACAVYLRRGEQTVFVAAKCRVVPIKSVTTPKLELQAALLGAKLANSVLREHSFNIERKFYWTDSKIVWFWINKGQKKRQTYVLGRLAAINETTKPDEWRWLPGDENVADDATRAEGKIRERWLQGPEFLRLPEEQWPNMEPEPDARMEEVLATDTADPQLVRKFIDETKFSNWRRLVRSMAFAILYIEKFIFKKPVSVIITQNLEERAENMIVKQSQVESFTEDIELLKKKEKLVSCSKLLKLNPEIDQDGLLHARSRLDAGRLLPYELKRPIILDAKHHVTKLIIIYYHKLLGHHSTETLLNELRQRYYILGLRNAVRSMISKCVICKIRRSKCVQPMMAPLPDCRLQHHCRPFTYCGIDLFGPLTISIGRRVEKRWAALFTCFSVRAVHTELVASLSADSTLMALRRMGARRGYPKVIYTDNGTNFTAANKELKRSVDEMLKDDKFLQAANALGVEWRFNPPEAPHMGGVWERLVRSVKTALSAVLFGRNPKEEVLSTLLSEAENIVNSRPLTHVSLDVDEEEALTPNHFLLGASNSLPLPGIFSDQDVDLRRQWRVAQRMADHFWSRWLKEYLPTLQVRNKWRRDSGAAVRLGDIVVVADPTAPRNTWPRGEVVSVVRGRDNRIRSAEVATKGGVLRRPVNRLVVLLNRLPPADD